MFSSKRVITIISFILALVIVFGAIYRVLSFKYLDGILSLKYLYKQQDDSVDVLVLGSSHAFMSVNTGVLYEDYGIASYVCGGSVQPMWNTYYFLKEVLKTQHPKLVLIEGLSTTFEDDYSDHSRIIKNTGAIRGLKNRLDAITVSAPVEDVWDYIFNYRLWHSRYEEINERDFSDYYHTTKMQYYKGFSVNYQTVEVTKPAVASFSADSVPIREKSEEYYRKLLELCISEDLPVMVVVCPYALTEAKQQKYNYVRKITEEYGISFINFNSDEYYEEMGLDFATDFGDSSSHLNYSGNVKFTKLLGEMIDSRFDLPDRRGDDEYVSWEMNSKDLAARLDDHIISKSDNIYEILKHIKGRDELTVYAVTYSDAAIIEEKSGFFTGIGITGEELDDETVYLSENGSVQILGIREYDINEKLAHKILSIYSEDTYKDSSLRDGEEGRAYMRIDGADIMDERNGCYFVIYDRFTEEIVTVCHLIYSGNGEVLTVIRNFSE